MAYQIPKTNHPWRRYQNRFDKEETESIPSQPKHVKPLKLFLMEIISNWDNMEVTVSNSYEQGRFKLYELSQSKIAAWLANLLRRNYAG